MKHITIIPSDKGGVGKTLVSHLTDDMDRNTAATKMSLAWKHNGEMNPHPKSRNVIRGNALAMVGCDQGRRISRRL